MAELDKKIIDYCKAEEEFIKKIDKKEIGGLDTLNEEIKKFREQYFKEHNIVLKK